MKIPYFSEIIQAFYLFLAVVTSYIGLKTFNRNKKQELENQLFKIKIEALSKLMYEIDNFFIILNRSIVKLSIIEDSINSEEEKEKQLLELSLEIDEQLYKSHSMIVKYSVFFSSNSTNKLLEFSSNILGDFEESSNEKEVLEQYYQEQLELADNISNILREELKLEKLHKSLYLRYK